MAKLTYLSMVYLCDRLYDFSFLITYILFEYLIIDYKKNYAC